MSEHDDSWDPADGPPPTDEERADARALADRIANAPGARPRGADGDLDDLVSAALRVRATAHPDAERARAVAADAVNYALTQTPQRWYRSRWRWLAAVAAVILGLGGAQLAVVRPLIEQANIAEPAITHPATDVFTAGVGDDPGSLPITRITDSRMRSYRDVLLHAHAAARGSQ